MGDVSIESTLNGLPEKSVTVYTLKALDYVVPGEWKNITSFDDMITDVAGHVEPARRREIAARAQQLFDSKETGLARALWLYQMTDKADAALGTAAMADKIGERIQFLSFLSRLTPSADTSQAIDLALKITAELLAFCFINGVPRSREGIARFASEVGQSYRSEALMRMAALVCLDGIIPLGPDFVSKVGSILSRASSSDFSSNPLFGTVGKLIPGDSDSGKLGFISESFGSMRGWMNGLVERRGLTTEKVTSSLRKFVEFSDDKLDYVAAFFDLTTNYYTHTGTQTVARTAIRQAIEQLDNPGLEVAAAAALPPMSDFAAAPAPVASGDSKTGRALYDYLASSGGYLSMTKGEVVTIRGGEQGGWYQATNSQGQTGWVPHNDVDLTAAPVAAPAAGPRQATLSQDNYGSAFQARAGEPLTISGDEKNGWYWATNAQGQSGWVAAGIVKFK